MSWWVIIATPTAGRHVYELGDPGVPGPDEAPFAAELAAIRAEHGIPADWLDRRIDLGEDWNVQLTEGDPHPELLWSREEISAAREALEGRDDARGNRQKIKALRDALAGAGGGLAPAARKVMTDELGRLERGVTGPPLEEVRAKLQREVPPSCATVHRKPPKPPKDTTPRG